MGLKDAVAPGLGLTGPGSFPKAAFPGPLSLSQGSDLEDVGTRSVCCHGCVTCCSLWDCPVLLLDVSRCPAGAPAPAASCQPSSASLLPAFKGEPGPWAAPRAPSIGQLAQFCPNFLKPFARGMRQMTERRDLREFGCAGPYRAGPPSCPSP